MEEMFPVEIIHIDKLYYKTGDTGETYVYFALLKRVMIYLTLFILTNFFVFYESSIVRRMLLDLITDEIRFAIRVGIATTFFIHYFSVLSC